MTTWIIIAVGYAPGWGSFISSVGSVPPGGRSSGGAQRAPALKAEEDSQYLAAPGHTQILI